MKKSTTMKVNACTYVDMYSIKMSLKHKIMSKFLQEKSIKFLITRNVMTLNQSC